VIIHQRTRQIIATAFANGSTHDFRLFKESKTVMACQVLCLAVAGYQGLADLYTNSRTPKKKSKHHPLTVEHVIGKVKVFRILSERYRNRRKRFGLRFNLIASLYNLELS